MAISRVTFAAAACSWIDPATGLPEVDHNPITEPSASRAFFVGNNGYRFCNFMEVWVNMDSVTGLVTGHGFTAQSGMYRGPSYARLPSHAFTERTEIFTEPAAVRFTQIVGARTVSPEVLGTGGGVLAGALAFGALGSVVPAFGTALGLIAGGLLGAFSGEMVGHHFLGFPPIWSKIQIRIYRDGRTEAQLLQHSLFPSLTFYEQGGGQGAAFSRVNHPNGSGWYNALKTSQLPDWQRRGWGPMESTSAPGPCGGNPWGVTKGVTGGAENLPSPR
jgi:hypothetical protein